MRLMFPSSVTASDGETPSNMSPHQIHGINDASFSHSLKYKQEATQLAVLVLSWHRLSSSSLSPSLPSSAKHIDYRIGFQDGRDDG
jgi:hypothetical protein